MNKTVSDKTDICKRLAVRGLGEGMGIPFIRTAFCKILTYRALQNQPESQTLQDSFSDRIFWRGDAKTFKS